MQCAQSCRVHVALKDVFPYTKWSLQEVAAAAGGACVRTFALPQEGFQEQGYRHETTLRLNCVVRLTNAKVFEFVRLGNCNEPAVDAV